ncbi:UNVERIFIED_CONTAM: hypothetical protein GTU68_056495 [Idotea baltica]|nr:hypothetical protein [Idotea baltica]
MRHVAAYLLATISDDNAKPTAEKIQSILGSVGVEADEKQLQIVIEKFAGQSPAALIAKGSSMLASMPSGGGAAASSGGGDAAPGPGAGGDSPAKKEEKKEEPEEESDDDMGFGLFD